MKLSRKWLNEYVDLPLTEIDDRTFAEAMTVSGSKVETTDDLSKCIKNVVVGRIMSIEKHPDSDHMFIVRMDVGKEQTVQIVTGAWNIHVDDLVPVALDQAVLPSGMEIKSGKLRGVLSQGMLCSLKELNLSTHDYAYAEIHAAAILGDYHPINKEKPSISPDIAPGEKIYGPVIAARVIAVVRAEGSWSVKLDLNGTDKTVICPFDNLHEGDMVAFDTKKAQICSLTDLHAQQSEFPH